MTNPAGWKLGYTSEQYESGGHGPGAISSGIDDAGGVSYGTYQLSSKMGTVKVFLDQSAYKDQFKALEPTTPAFDAQWQQLAKTDVGFGQAQHNFIKATHYDKQVEHLKADGLDLTGRGPAVQDALWSTSVQYGGHTRDIFEKGLQEKFGKDYKLSDLSEKDIVGAAQDYKTAHNESLFASSPAKTRQHILDRIQNEKADLLSLADGKVVDHSVHHGRNHAASHQAADGTLHQGMHGEQVQKLQTQLGELGYRDNTATPDGKFGPATRNSVKAYQHDHHLPEVGHAGPATQKAIKASLQPLKQDNTGPLPAVSVMSSLPAGAPGLDDPRNAFNPNNALYNKLQQRIPDASEQRLLQFTAACHEQGITNRNLTDVHMDRQNGTMNFGGSQAGEVFKATSVNLKEPSPQPAQSIQHIQQTDQHQAQIQTRVQATIAQNNQQGQQGPTPGGPMHH